MMLWNKTLVFLQKLERNNMPLVKSKSPVAFRKNVAAEVKAGKPVKQAVAIAYSVKRNVQSKPAPKGKNG